MLPAQRIAALALSSLLCVPPACTINPVSGRPELVLTSVEREREIGRQETRKLEATIGFVRDPEIAGYVDAIARRLAVHSPRRDVGYHAHVVNMVEPNAFALPGGYVFVSRGLLALANSEDELANVLGHEIGHVAGRHAVQREAIALPIAIVTGLGALATSIVSRRLASVVSGVGGIAGGLVLAPYSRDQERAADRIGQGLAAKAGWDPAGLAAFLQTLEREEALVTGGVRRTGFFDTHPSTPERVADARARVATLERAPGARLASSRDEFMSRLDGLLVGEDPAAGTLVEGRFLHPDLDFGVTFPAGWPVRNAPDHVASRSEAGDAIVVLQVVAEGEDPVAAAREAPLNLPLDGEIEAVAHPALPAARADGNARGVRVRFTWLAHQGRIYRLTAAAEEPRFEPHRAGFEAVARSFRPLTAEERGAIRAARLRVVRAREGEDLDAIVKRAGSAWSADEAAVANALARDARLARGAPIKLAISEPWRSAP